MSLSEKSIMAKTKATNLSSVRHLNCWGSRISDVSVLKKLPNVEVITLSTNHIETLRPFAQCLQLKELFLRKNKIADINEIAYLMDLPALSVLWLSGNPMSTYENYRATVIKALPRLTKLDNIEITPEERKASEASGSDVVMPVVAAEGKDEDEDDGQDNASDEEDTTQSTKSADVTLQAVELLLQTLDKAALQSVIQSAHQLLQDM
eukprot:m.211917 g.211917  ORF g.211917 m.211917 type:complete len:207 (-) comp15068_c1_seq2:1986-2606(-)